MAHGVEQHVGLLLVREACGDVSDAGVEDFRVEDVESACSGVGCRGRGRGEPPSRVGAVVHVCCSGKHGGYDFDQLFTATAGREKFEPGRLCHQRRLTASRRVRAALRGR